MKLEGPAVWAELIMDLVDDFVLIGVGATGR
jgi:hypothetical protein